MLEGKIYPLGPCSADGEIHPIIKRSRSFASDLHEDFLPVHNSQISDELRKHFEYENYEGEKVVDVKYLPVDELPRGSYIEKGYFLIDDVRRYESNESSLWDVFYDKLSPVVYAAMLDKELRFGQNKPKLDVECEEYDATEPNASDYMYYAYPNYMSREYEASVIRDVVDMLEDYGLPSGTKYVALEIEG